MRRWTSLGGRFAGSAGVRFMANFESKGGKLFIDGKEVIKGWETTTGWYHFATEDHGEHEYEVGGKTVVGREFFGYVQGFENEWGYFTDAEFRPLIKQGKMWEIKRGDLPYAGRRE